MSLKFIQLMSVIVLTCRFLHLLVLSKQSNSATIWDEISQSGPLQNTTKERRRMRFRVMGGKTVAYYVDVEAKDRYEALEKAELLESHKWQEIEVDDVIEPYEVIGEEE